MKTIKELGLRIPAATREYYRYSGVSAELERRGLGSSRADLASAQREKRREIERSPAGHGSATEQPHSNQKSKK